MNAVVKKTINIDKANKYWNVVPDWVQVLAAECDKTSQERTGKRIGYSNGSIVNQVLKCDYTASMSTVERAVRGALMNATVDCPVIGQMLGDMCLEHQKKPFAATNPMRLKLYKACRNGCPNKRG